MKGAESVSLQLRAFRNADYTAVERVLGNVWGANHDALAYYRYGEPLEAGERYLHTLVAEHDG